MVLYTKGSTRCSGLSQRIMGLSNEGLRVAKRDLSAFRRVHEG